MNVVVIDGQSGRMGQLFIERAKAANLNCTFTAIGTNAIATAAMRKAGAEAAATGENPVIVQCRTAGVIAGPIGITLADAMLGEVSPKMAAAVGQSEALRVLIPSDRCSTFVAGVAPGMTRRQLVDAAVARILLAASGAE